MLAGALPVCHAGAAQSGQAVASPAGFAAEEALYAHAVVGSDDGEAWQAWQSVHDESLRVSDPSEKYFFLPTSADSERVDVYNGFETAVTVGDTEIAPHTTATLSYTTAQGCSVRAGNKTFTLNYMRSHAEAAVYINNPDADGKGSDLMTYLNADKARYAAATGAIVTPDGKIDNTAVKKIKGRGNTSWGKPKKGYNITYDKKVSVAGMVKNKKYSLLPNYQDDSLARNRFLYDLSDAVGMPYASDSRFVDFYVNGFYWGSYQMAEKVEEGSLVTDVTGKEYLNEDGTVREDFPFIAEVDASAGNDDYYVECLGGVKVTIKAPEIDPGEPGYNEVKAYVADKFNRLLSACRAAIRTPSKSVAGLIDLDSAAKLYLINELGKNWDAGVSSTFLTYKQDADGSYRFFGSPVWDYDNSLGNAVGVGSELQNMGVSDYQQYTGWWCRFKGKAASDTMSYNIINNLARNKEVQQTAARVWFEDFLPAIDHFSGRRADPQRGEELYTRDEYDSLLSESAAMNYRSGWLLNTGSWIAPHTSLRQAAYDVNTGTYSVAPTATRYAQSFRDMFCYAADWMVSRAAWLSDQMRADYFASATKYDVDRDGVFTINDASEVQRFLAEFITLTQLQTVLADADGNGSVNVDDVTHMQRVLAHMIEEPQPTEPVEPTAPAVPEGAVTFVNTLDWTGDIHIYYYGNGQYSDEWPGVPMTQTADIENKAAYYFEVPSFAQYVIFNDGTVQTEKIPYDGAAHTYRAVDQLNEKGRYLYTVD